MTLQNTIYVCMHAWYMGEKNVQARHFNFQVHIQLILHFIDCALHRARWRRFFKNEGQCLQLIRASCKQIYQNVCGFAIYMLQLYTCMYFLRARLTDWTTMSTGGFAATTGTKSDLSFTSCTGPPSFWPLCVPDPSRGMGLPCMGSWMSFFSCVVTCTSCTAASLFDKRTSSSANSFRRHAFTCELSHA